jgi:hypothetical protein
MYLFNDAFTSSKYTPIIYRMVNHIKLEMSGNIAVMIYTGLLYRNLPGWTDEHHETSV